MTWGHVLLLAGIGLLLGFGLGLRLMRRNEGTGHWYRRWQRQRQAARIDQLQPLILRGRWHRPRD